MTIDPKAGLSQKWIFTANHGGVYAMGKVTAAEVRYIKLGPGNAWVEDALTKGHLPFGDIHDKHELGLQRNWPAQEAVYVCDKGVIPGKAKSFAREMRDF